VDDPVRHPAHSRRLPHHRHALFARLPSVSSLLAACGYPLPDIYSSRWYARVKGRDAATTVLSKLRNLPSDHAYIQEEIDHVMNQIDHERQNTVGKGLVAEFSELARKGNRNRIAIGVSLFVFMQMAGSNAINFYSPRVFKSIGLSGTSTGLYATGIYGVVRFVAVVIAMVWVVDRFGRTRMLIYGSALMSACMWYIGGYVMSSNPAASTKHISAGGYVACTLIYVYAIGFCFSWAGVPWIYCSEIFPLRIRGICVAMCTATHWLMNFVIARSVPYMITNIGGGTYFVFASFLAAAVAFVFFFIPETKGLNMESMDELFGVPGAGTHLAPRDQDEEKVLSEMIEQKC
jgi:sugar porter (SP) family MFS transporter